MTNEEIKKIYLSAEKTLALLETPQGADIKKANRELYDIAYKTVEKYRAEYFDIVLNEKPQSAQLMKETEEAVEALKIIPENSHSSVVELNNLILSNTEKIQSQLLFSEESFYDKYFISLPSKIKDTIDENIMSNERFKEWFANSKVVDKTGNPLVLYHGSGGSVDEFTQFKFSPFPANYFAENKSYAEWFATYRSGNSYLFKCYLRVTNPIDLTEFEVDKVVYEDFVGYIKYRYGYELPENKMLRAMSDNMKGIWAWQYLRNGVDWLKLIASKKEFDGFYYYENNPQDIIAGKENITKAWMVFYPNQIKAADARNTTFSLFSKDIRMKKGGKLCS